MIKPTETKPEHTTPGRNLQKDHALAMEAVRAVAAHLGGDAYAGGDVPLSRLAVEGPLAGADRHAKRRAIEAAERRGWLAVTPAAKAEAGSFGGRIMRARVTLDGATALAAGRAAAEGMVAKFDAAMRAMGLEGATRGRDSSRGGVSCEVFP